MKTVILGAFAGAFLALCGGIIITHEVTRPIEDKCRLAGGTITNNRCFVEMK